MRDFLKKISKDLYTLTGLKQVEGMNTDQLILFIDSLEKACNRFGRIPEKMKIKIIENQVMQDVDLKKLTPAKITQWLSSYWANLDPATRQRYMREPEEETTSKVLSPEEAQPYIDILKKQLAEIQENQAPKVDTKTRFYGRDMQAIKINQKIVECPGYISLNEHQQAVNNPCAGVECPKCMGFGKIKVMA
jgi:hypothetical protein